MEKLGIRGDILYSELRDEEARLMQLVQSAVSDNEKIAEDRVVLESRLSQIRNKITELDLKNP